MKKELNRDFYRYVLPSMISMLLSGFYSMVDGIFVGNAVGSQALAAINLVYPVQACMNATAFGLGVGGAVLMSKYRGSEDYEEADRAAGTAITTLVVAGFALMGLFWLSLDWCISMLGGSGTIADYAHEYISIIIFCGIFPVLGNGITPLIRNQGKTVEATLFMSSGLITNIILDYLFVFRMGMGLAGAAIATVIAQAVVAAFNLSYLFRNNRNIFSLDSLKLSCQRLKTIIRIGVSPFGQTLIPSVIIIFTNWQCIRYGGDDALSVSLLRAQITTLFGLTGSLAQQAQPALIITACSFLMVGITRCISAYFYAVEKTNVSTLLVYIEPCLFFPIALWTLPLFWGLNGVWAAYPAAQLALAVLCIALYIRVEHRSHTAQLKTC